MNYDDPVLRDRLAAEYVLGTLRGRARDRLERLLQSNVLLRGDVERWERQLNAMALTLPPREPPRAVRRRIRRRIAQPRAMRARWSWPLAAGAATAAAAVLAVYVIVAPPSRPAFDPEYIAAIGERTQGPRWSIMADLERETLSVRAIRAAEIDPDQALELWLLPGGDEAPISLGLLPESGKRQYTIPHEAVAAAPQAAGIAISREPAGGSPTGAPTGPVLFQGELVPI